ncbi:glycoside hydrolase family protein [Caulobacter mirabilis]|uniref:Lysozyme n=1 Tax=Caulobacter mirabilis TaxID=69666 RepID=A0A2D2AXB0_9CAUL|nr:glycoside hydrolase family protein [Caulobacter mirabilis]ATQ42615.1 lysozyme [Caulobacter mirabilis]
MKPRQQVSRAAIELIKTFEGYRRKAAQLPDGRWTIGYGHTLTAREGAEVSEPDAEALLMYDLINVAHAVNEQVFTPLTQNQFDALCAFTFNVGVENFRRSSVLRRVNEGQLLQAACAMEMWRKADFEGERIVIDALVRRRSAEKTLFLTPANGWVPAPSPILRPKVDYDAVNAVPRETPTPVVTTTVGNKVVAERDAAVQPRPIAPPVPVPGPLATETAAANLNLQLAQIFPDEPQEVSAPAPAAEPEHPPITVPDGPAFAAAPPPPPPAFVVHEGGAQDFVLTPAPEASIETAPRDAFRIDAPEPIADDTPGLFDVAVGDVAAGGPTQALVSEDYVRRLVREDEYASLARDLDPALAVTPTEPARIRGLPLFALAAAGLGLFAGGVYWTIGARAGDGLSGPPVIGMAISLIGMALVGLTIYFFLKTLADAPIEDDEEHQDEREPRA